MKKKNLILSALLFFSVLPMTLFTGCDKDTNCYLDVKVIDEATRGPVSGAIINVWQDGGTVQAAGITDGSGEYSTHFSAPAIVKIKATLQVYDLTDPAHPIPLGERRGETSVRLKEGETVHGNITLPAQVYYN